MSFVVSLIGKHAGEVIEMPHYVAQTCVEVQKTHRWATEQDIKQADVVRSEGERPMVSENVLPPGYGIKPDPVRGWHVLDPGGVPLTADGPLENAQHAKEYAIKHYNDIGGGMKRPLSKEEQKAQREAEEERQEAAEAELEMKRKADQDRRNRYGLPQAPTPAEDDGPQRERTPRAQAGGAQEGPRPAQEHPRSGRKE
jgi:hypothetical protein